MNVARAIPRGLVKQKTRRKTTWLSPALSYLVLLLFPDTSSFTRRMTKGKPAPNDRLAAPRTPTSSRRWGSPGNHYQIATYNSGWLLHHVQVARDRSPATGLCQHAATLSCNRAARTDSGNRAPGIQPIGCTTYFPKGNLWELLRFSTQHSLLSCRAPLGRPCREGPGWPLTCNVRLVCKDVSQGEFPRILRRLWFRSGWFPPRIRDRIVI